MKLFQKIFPYWAYKILELEKRLPDSARLQDLIGKSLDTISDVSKNTGGIATTGQALSTPNNATKDIEMTARPVHIPTDTNILKHKHEKFQEVLTDIKCGNSPMLIGPAGSGKSTLLEQVACELQLPYYAMSVNEQTSEYNIIGYNNANGQYVGTAFRDAFEFGGIFSFEEIDAANPNVFTVINNAMSQGNYLFPDRKFITKHPDFHMVASANTFGSGASLQYIGRNRMDGATIDRFSYVYTDYDEYLEQQLCTVPEWCDYVHQIRKYVREFNMPIIVSTRAIVSGANLLNANMTVDDVCKKLIWRGLPQSDIDKIKGGIESKYISALAQHIK